MQIESTVYKIYCCEKDGYFRWVRDDGEFCSPRLSSEQKAKDYASQKPLVTLDEQIEQLQHELAKCHKKLFEIQAFHQKAISALRLKNSHQFLKAVQEMSDNGATDA